MPNMADIEDSEVSFGEASVDDVVGTLEDIYHVTGFGLGRVFRDWIRLAVCAFERNDKQYLEILDDYALDGDEQMRGEVAHLFSEALGECIAATVNQGQPVIGTVYEESGAQADNLGQHFTPWPISRLNAQTLIQKNDVQEASSDDPLTISDSTLGVDGYLSLQRRLSTSSTRAHPYSFLAPIKTAHVPGCAF